MKQCGLPVLIIWGILCSVPVCGQDGAPVPDPEKTLFEKTLALDIRTADYYELVAWCRDLGLPEAGSADQLRSQLLRHYGLEGTAPPAASKAKTEITIKSARETEYFTVTEVGEAMVLLSGDVILEIRESDKSRAHIISAEKVMFNQEQKTITAYGSIEYVLDDNGKKETFHGDSLTFSVESWEGVIFEGDSSREEVIQDKKVKFFFSGKRISRTGHNVVIMNDGVITTGSLKDPDFSIRSKKIWVTGIQEWTILHGLLYMGNVPVLYIPFYFKPGNDLFFNPVLGEDVRKGPLVQTTTYLLGHKKIDSTGDFLQIGLEPGSVFELKRIGLYSYKVKKVTADPNENTLKLMADYYTRLGGYAGVDGQFYALGPIETIDFRFGLGVTRSIDSGYNVFFSEEDEYLSRWNESWMFGTRLPIRYGTYLKIKAGVWTFNWEMYSDPSYYTDFDDRQENFDWLNFAMSDFTSQELEDKTYSRDITQYLWSVNGSWALKGSPLAPWVTDLSLSYIKGSVTFEKKTDSGVAADDPYAPTRYYFAPSKVSLPNLALSLSGTLLTLPGGASVTGESENTGSIIDQPPDPELPWAGNPGSEAVQPDGSGSKPAGGEDFIIPDRRGDLAVAGEGEPYRFTLSYTFSPSFNMDTPTDTSGWTGPDDAELKFRQSALTLGSQGDLRYDLNLLQNFLSVKGSLGVRQNWKTHADLFGSGEDLTDSEKLSDYSSTSFEWGQQLSVSALPLRNILFLESSTLNYTFNSTLYRYQFVSYTAGSDPVFLDEWMRWERDFVSQHQFGGTLVFKPPLVTLSCQAMTDLPPEPKTFFLLPQVAASWRGLTGSVSDRISYDYDLEEWSLDDLTINAQYKAFNGKLSLSQKILYNLEESRLQESFSRMDLWFFYAQFKMLHTTGYDWDRLNNRWVARSHKEFIPSEFLTGILFDWTMKPLWRNRIQLRTGVDLKWRINLIQPTDNVLSFSWNMNFNLYRFLDLKFEVISENRNMYIYFEEWRDYFGLNDEEDYDLLTDLLKSFNFFSPGQQDRYDSFFDLSKINLTLVHHLRDWDLSFTYSGFPKRQDDEYIWDSTFTLSLAWNPIPTINTRIQYQDETYYIDSGQSNTQK